MEKGFGTVTPEELVAELSKIEAKTRNIRNKEA
jgi:hypothetical protein